MGDLQAWANPCNTELSLVMSRKAVRDQSVSGDLFEYRTAPEGMPLSHMRGPICPPPSQTGREMTTWQPTNGRVAYWNALWGSPY